MKPIIELSFFPKYLAGGDAIVFWWRGNVTPPANFDKWVILVQKFIRHCISRYSFDEVKKWYFEIWNEPNLKGFWNADMETYFEFYKATALAIKDIDPALRVGGPATSSFNPEEHGFEALKQKMENNFTGLTPNAKFTIKTLDKQHGFALKKWQEMGSPEPPDRQQTNILIQNGLKLKSNNTVADSSGNLLWKPALEPWNIISITEIV